MNIKLTQIRTFGLVAFVGLLTNCASPTPEVSPSANVSPSASATPALTPIAKISEIQNLPVFVHLLSAAQEQPAKEGMGLQLGETIRTQGRALAQIDLNSGLAFRLAGDAVLTLQPDNRLNLTAGDMITWIQPGKKVPTEIVTPAGVAGIRGTTVFVKIPKNPQEGVLFFAWEGSVAVRLPGQQEEVLLKTAEEVRIKPGDRNIGQIRQRVRRLSRAEWRQKRQADPLLHSFKKAPMSTLSIINQIKPGQVTLIAPVSKGQGEKTNVELKRTNDRQPSDRSPAKSGKPNKPGKPDKPDKADKAERRPEQQNNARSGRANAPEKKPEKDKPEKEKPEKDNFKLGKKPDRLNRDAKEKRGLGPLAQPGSVHSNPPPGLSKRTDAYFKAPREPQPDANDSPERGQSARAEKHPKK